VTSTAKRIRAPAKQPAFGALEYGFWAFLVVALGRIGELIPGLGSLPIGKLAVVVPLIILITRWRELPRLADSAKGLARNATWLIVLVIVLTPFSIWGGASRQFLLSQLPILIVVTVLAYMMCRSWSAVRGTLRTLVLSSLVLTIAALSTYGGGRAAANTMYDTNDLAYLLVTVLPLSVGFVLNSTRGSARMANVGITAALLTALLLTQSRGGFLGLITVAVLLVFGPISVPRERLGATRKRSSKKFLIVLGAVCVGAIIWSQLPEGARARLATVVSLSEDYNLDPTDRTGRGQIWTRAFEATLDRPIGYGPDVFPMVDVKYGGKFMAPHNSFVQIMVELGVLGLLLFARMFILAWRTLGRVRQKLTKSDVVSREQAEQASFARLLQIAVAGNAVSGFFLSMAYATVVWVIFGTCMALSALANADAGET
jgi:O-antigen ligase